MGAHLYVIQSGAHDVQSIEEVVSKDHLRLRGYFVLVGYGLGWEERKRGEREGRKEDTVRGRKIGKAM